MSFVQEYAVPLILALWIFFIYLLLKATEVPGSTPMVVKIWTKMKKALTKPKH